MIHNQSDGTYNGYVNYQTWNVCLWIGNDEFLYGLANQCESYNDFKILLRDVFDSNDLKHETPDGVSWSDSNINLAEMKEFWAESFSKVCA